MEYLNYDCLLKLFKEVGRFNLSLNFTCPHKLSGVNQMKLYPKTHNYQKLSIWIDVPHRVWCSFVIQAVDKLLLKAQVSDRTDDEVDIYKIQKWPEIESLLISNFQNNKNW